MPHMCIMVIIMLLPQSCFVMACSLSRRTGGVSCRWVHVSTIRGICQPLFFIFFHHDANFFSWRQESKHAKEECFSGFSIVDKEFSLSDVHTFFTDSFLLKMGRYGIYLLMVEFAYLPAKPDRYAIVLIAGILKEELFVVTQET